MSGLKSGFEEVYALLAVNHMLSGEAYAQALHGHILILSALMTLWPEDFIANLTGDELQELETVYKSTDSEEKYSKATAK